MPDAHADMMLPAGAQAPRAARDAISQLLDGETPPQVIDDVRLATTEIVSNAVRHAGIGADSLVRLTIHVTDEVIQVEVIQPTSAAGARLVTEGASGIAGGYGLALVEAAADRWGVEAGPPGRVWFERTRSR